MSDHVDFPAAVNMTEAWLDMLLLATSLALAPYEWGGHFVIACARMLGGSE